MTKIAVLIPDTFPTNFSAADRQRLNQLGTVTWYAGEKAPTVEQAKDLLVDCDIALGSWGTPNPGANGLLEVCPKLRLWEHVAGSVKHFSAMNCGTSPLSLAVRAPSVMLWLSTSLAGNRRFAPNDSRLGQS